MTDDKLKINKDEVNVVVYPRDEGEYIRPVAVVYEKPAEHETRADTHEFERPLSMSVGGGFGFSEDEIESINEHLSWLRSEYFEDLKP